MSYLADYLDALEAFLRRFVIFRSDAQVTAIALWIAHTHAFEASDATPYLAVTSAERRSGKTRLLESLALLVATPSTWPTRAPPRCFAPSPRDRRCSLTRSTRCSGRAPVPRPRSCAPSSMRATDAERR
jgi:hypothetical protein